MISLVVELLKLSRKMNIKTNKTEFKELLSNLSKAALFISDKATRAKDSDLARRVIRSKHLLEKRNGSFEGEGGNCN